MEPRYIELGSSLYFKSNCIDITHTYTHQHSPDDFNKTQSPITQYQNIQDTIQRKEESIINLERKEYKQITKAEIIKDYYFNIFPEKYNILSKQLLQSCVLG